MEMPEGILPKDKSLLKSDYRDSSYKEELEVNLHIFEIKKSVKKNEEKKFIWHLML